jgi:hypothetical protein
MIEPLFVSAAMKVEINTIDDYWSCLLAYKRRGIPLRPEFYNTELVRNEAHNMSRQVLAMGTRLLEVRELATWPAHLFSEYIHQAYIGGREAELKPHVTFALQRGTAFDIGLLQRLGSYASFIDEANAAWASSQLNSQMPKSVVVDYLYRAFRSEFIDDVRPYAQSFDSEEVSLFFAMEKVSRPSDLNIVRQLLLRRAGRMCPIQSYELHRDFGCKASKTLADYSRKYSAGFVSLQLGHYRKRLLAMR